MRVNPAWDGLEEPRTTDRERCLGKAMMEMIGGFLTGNYMVLINPAVSRNGILHLLQRDAASPSKTSSSTTIL